MPDMLLKALAAAVALLLDPVHAVQAMGGPGPIFQLALDHPLKILALDHLELTN